VRFKTQPVGVGLTTVFPFSWQGMAVHSRVFGRQRAKLEFKL